MSRITPTQRTLKELRRLGYLTAIVEHWNAYAKIRQDLFGFIDVLGIKKDEILAVQTTTTSSLSAREKKSLEAPQLRRWLEAGGRFELWGWAKRGKRDERKVWTLRKVELTIDSLPEDS